MSRAQQEYEDLKASNPQFKKAVEEFETLGKETQEFALTLITVLSASRATNLTHEQRVDILNAVIHHSQLQASYKMVEGLAEMYCKHSSHFAVVLATVLNQAHTLLNESSGKVATLVQLLRTEEQAPRKSNWNQDEGQNDG